MVQLDHFSTEQKHQYIIASTSIGLALSTVSMVARLFARLRTVSGLREEDWIMTAALVLSYGTAICLLYGVPVQGVPLTALSPSEIKGFLLMIWIIQKLQPPTLFAIKVSIIIFHAHIFQSRTFRLISWAVAIFTALWVVANVLGSTFQCSPPSYFYDKSGGPRAGSCIRDPIHRMGVPHAILSSVGDVIIFVMPIPPLLKLTIPRRTKIGLIGVFSLGLFVLIASCFRWIALIGAAPKAFNSDQIQVGVWTYLEISVAITCGNLPFLAPLMGCVGPRRKHQQHPSSSSNSSSRRRPPSSSLIRYFPARRLGGGGGLGLNLKHHVQDAGGIIPATVDLKSSNSVTAEKTSTSVGSLSGMVDHLKPLPCIPPQTAVMGRNLRNHARAQKERDDHEDDEEFARLYGTPPVFSGRDHDEEEFRGELEFELVQPPVGKDSPSGPVIHVTRSVYLTEGRHSRIPRGGGDVERAGGGGDHLSQVGWAK